MENTLQQIQFKDRLCRTLLRVNWIVAIAAILPVLSKIFFGIAVIGMAFYFLILIAFTLITLGLFLLDDSFRALYHVNLDGLQEFSDQIVKAYRIALPVLAGVCVVVSGIILFVILRNQDETHKTGRIVSVCLAFFLLLLAALLYYITLV